MRDLSFKHGTNQVYVNYTLIPGDFIVDSIELLNGEFEALPLALQYAIEHEAEARIYAALDGDCLCGQCIES